MANFPKPSEIQTTYYRILKSIKPSLNTNDLNSDFVIRGKVISGLVSGLYGDQAKVNNDTFTSTARPEALILKGADLGLTIQPATQASGTSVVNTGPNGTVVNAGDLTFIYGATNLFYTNITGGTIAGGMLAVSVRAEVSGSLGNIIAPDSFTVVSPPTGVSTVAQVTANIAGGSDVESTDSFRARILARQQNTPSGGNAADYVAWGFAADPSVRSVSIRRFIKGLGTVGVAITTGPTDVDTAVTNGTTIVRVPSEGVIASVQAYYDSKAPLTDCVTVFGPTETAFNVMVAVDLVSGFNLDTVPSSPTYNPMSLTIRQLINREVGRALYKVPIGGRPKSGGTQGYVYASDIEINLDTWLSAETDPLTGLAKGIIPVLANRQVLPLVGMSYEAPIDTNSLAKPGTITIVLGVP